LWGGHTKCRPVKAEVFYPRRRKKEKNPSSKKGREYRPPPREEEKEEKERVLFLRRKMKSNRSELHAREERRCASSATGEGEGAIFNGRKRKKKGFFFT